MTTAPAWVDLPAVLEHVGCEPNTPAAGQVARAAAAAAAYVERQRPDLFKFAAAPPELPEDVPADVQYGTTLLAARWHARKSSPAGLVSYADFGAVPVSRLDVDVQQLLGVGRYAKPRVG